MPHVILRGTCSLEDVWRQFRPLTTSVGGWITKLTDCYLGVSHGGLLVEATAVYRGVTHNFYVRVDGKSDQITVRIEPRTNVEKNDGVKRAVALVANQLRVVAPVLSIEKTNLPPEMVAIVEATH